MLVEWFVNVDSKLVRRKAGYMNDLLWTTDLTCAWKIHWMKKHSDWTCQVFLLFMRCPFHLNGWTLILVWKKITALHKRENSSNWHYQFQFKNKKYVGSTGIPNKAKAHQVELEIRNKVHGEVFLGQAEETTLQHAVLKYLETRNSSHTIAAWSQFREKCLVANSILRFCTTTHAKDCLLTSWDTNCRLKILST